MLETLPYLIVATALMMFFRQFNSKPKNNDKMFKDNPNVDGDVAGIMICAAMMAVLALIIIFLKDRL
jgi:hypothetical protein